MRKLFLLAALMLSLKSFSQTTTAEDYNYLTNSYPTAYEKGNPIKEGFELKEIYSHKGKSFSATYYSFFEKSTKKSKAILIKISKNKNSKIRFLCLPYSNKDQLFSEFIKDTQKLGVSMQMYLQNTAFDFMRKFVELGLNDEDKLIETLENVK